MAYQPERAQHNDPRDMRQRSECAVSVRRITDDDCELSDKATNTRPVNAAPAPPTMMKKSCHWSGRQNVGREHLHLDATDTGCDRVRDKGGHTMASSALAPRTGPGASDLRTEQRPSCRRRCGTGPNRRCEAVSFMRGGSEDDMLRVRAGHGLSEREAPRPTGGADSRA